MAILGLALVVASTARAHGDLHEQIEVVSRQLAQAPTAGLYLQRGELQRVHRDFGAALEDFEAAERIDPRMDAVWLCRGRALLEAGHAGPARLALDEFLRREPTHATGHLVRAHALTKLGERKLALSDYDRAIELSAEPRPEMFTERAEAWLALGQPDAALASLEAGMKRLGALPSLQLPALDMEVRLQRYDAALRRLDTLLAATGRKERWLAQRAEILAQAGRPEEAAASRASALAAIEALPVRLRETRATQELEHNLRAADGGPATPLVP